MATKKNTNRVDYNDAEKIKAYCENDVMNISVSPVCDDWKARLKQEYVELKERYEKLRKYNIKKRIGNRLEMHPTKRYASYLEDNKEMLSAEMMGEQEEVMCRYLRLLEERMTLEGIDY